MSPIEQYTHDRFREARLQWIRTGDNTTHMAESAEEFDAWMEWARDSREWASVNEVTDSAADRPTKEALLLTFHNHTYFKVRYVRE